MKSLLLSIASGILSISSFSCSSSVQGDEDAKQATNEVLVVLGASGTEEYGKAFRDWGVRWKEACKGWDFTLIDGTTKEKTAKEDRKTMLEWIERPSSAKTRWLILIGHGTSSQKIAKFNLRGPDVSSEQLAESLNRAKGKWVIIDCTSSSGPFIHSLSSPDRVVIAATKSASEQNFARFGEYFSKAIIDSKSDLDHDDSVSVLEAFIAASNHVAEFYKSENRLASEHALLEDNGDKAGAAASFYRGVRPIKAPAKGKELDGRHANRIPIVTLNETKALSDEQLQHRNALEEKIELLRASKKDMKEDEYYRKLEEILIELAKVYSETAR